MTFRPVGLLGLALAALLSVTAPAWAQGADAGPISTASGSAPPPAAAGPAAPLPVDATAYPAGGGARDGKVRGMVEAGVGTGGYRHAAVAIDAPLQGGGEVAIAVDETQFDGASGRRREHAN